MDQDASDLERYGEEVLNASWLPQDVLRCEIGNEHLRADSHAAEAADITDLESYLRRLYMAQE